MEKMDEKSTMRETERAPDKETGRRAIKELLMRGYFGKHEFLVRMVFIRHLNQIAGVGVPRKTTWEDIEKTIIGIYKKRYDLPENATLKDCKAVGKEMAIQLGFPSFEMMAECIGMGKSHEKTKKLPC